MLAAAGIFSFVAIQSLGSSAANADGVISKGTSAAEIAEQRQAALVAESEAISQTNAETARAQRELQLASEDEAILSEATRLSKLSEFFWPVDGTVSPGNEWGMRYHPILHRTRLHDGTDISAKCNQPVWAAQSGEVTRTTSGYSGGSGNSVRIDHGKYSGHNIQTAYLHLSSFLVKEGEQVEKGQLIGYVGSTGLSTGCHLHLSLYEDGKGIDPMTYVHEPEKEK